MRSGWTGGEVTRREVLRLGVAAAAVAVSGGPWPALAGPLPEEIPTGSRPPQDKSVQTLHPRNRAPLSFIIDDSTCLVNMGHFCMPQFAAAWPARPEYRRPWQTWPREIPDAFVREFGEWCAQHGVRGKYSLVPYPACVGWLDRELPGWSKRALKDSLKLVRDLMVPNWDIHPEMITHTRVIDLKTGRPMAEMNDATMENSFPREKISADQFAAYISYALRILKNCDIECQGITTPGGFGNASKSELSAGVREAVRDVFATDVPHYFKYVSEGAGESTRPRLEHVSGLETDSPRLIVNIPAGTGDYFGGWDGMLPPQGHKYASDDASSGRMVELIEKGEPAFMLCHWAGLYSNGSKAGFEAFKKAALALEGKYRDQTIWMKTSEIARYWAARELTRIERNGAEITFTAPFTGAAFTARITSAGQGPPRLTSGGKPIPLQEAKRAPQLAPGMWQRDKDDSVIVCFDLPKGQTTLKV